MATLNAAVNNKLGCVEITYWFSATVSTEQTKNIAFYRGEDQDQAIITVTQKLTPGIQSYTVTVYDYKNEPGTVVSYSVEGQSCSVNYILNDAFLTDKERSLRIQYDPDVTSFKIVTDDAIIKTLGSRYPFARRNGDTYYRQFNIGGLISYEGEGGSFTRHGAEPQPLFVDTPPSISDSDNYNKMVLTERAYRDLVLDFLHDGKVKLFKSNTEGLIPVRLTNISLTPNKTLGRNIWSFSAQATEMSMPIESFVYGG